jgi:hypothetical protein
MIICECEIKLGVCESPVLTEDRPETEYRYHASLPLEIKDGCTLRSCVGFGVSVSEALAVLAQQISGRVVVKNAAGADRREWHLPHVMA